MIDPAWVDPDNPVVDEGWSVVCQFAISPRSQGNPSAATVRFALTEAPHGRLRPGTTLRLFERDTGQYAIVRIID